METPSHQTPILYRRTLIFLALFLAVRILSLALVPRPLASLVITLAILGLYLIILSTNRVLAWHILLGEFFLGGAGHMIELFGISIRTLFVSSFLLWWIGSAIIQKKYAWLKIPDKKLLYLSLALGIWAAVSAVHALEENRAPQKIIADLIPYGYFLLILPAYHLYSEKMKPYLSSLLLSFLLGSAIFSLGTFVLFSSGIEAVHGSYYTWFRDVLMGKITDMGSGFFRVVLPEHLLNPGIMTVTASLLMEKNQKYRGLFFIVLLGTIPLALNLSRTYVLGLMISFLCLLFFRPVKRWLAVSLAGAGCFFAVFTVIHLLASGGMPGWDMLGIRFGSIARPTIEASAYTRMELLQPIGRVIRRHPILGTGLGASITFSHPYTKEWITTTQFDWGYLEMWAEIGLLGLFFYILILVRLGILLARSVSAGFFSSLVGLGIMNITAPVFFHVFGVAIIVVMTVFVSTFFGRYPARPRSYELA